ncbi:hypothetical protein [Aeromonas aquatica]|uniref:hypothetical protein n=1 Tax=Aeromonas aquatica TaxID=558964 RepID=UPI00051B8E92|nr:hypothetical protein [Aeromonas aquatica]
MITSDKSRSTAGTKGAPQPEITPPANGTHPAVEQMTQSTHKVVDKLADAVNSATTTFNDKNKDLQEAKDSYFKKVRTQIKNNPMSYVMLAVLLGFLVAWIFF